MKDNQTIFALASGHGVCGVAIIRISGPASFKALNSFGGSENPTPRTAVMVALKHPTTNELLDQGIVLPFRAPASFTGEDVVELHVHGGRAVIDGVLEALASVSDCRPAEAGEFTRRAFENGKLDLTSAEGLGDLLMADTSMQRDQALRQMDGGLRAIYEGWRSSLVGFLAHLEADIDFPDEDMPEGISGQVLPQIQELKSDIAAHLADNKRGQRLRDGFRVVILGAPNVGKSTLLNALAKSDVAIVSDEAGTTRDSIEVQLDLGGYPVRLIDTAGIRDGAGAVEAEGIRRSLRRADEADLKLVLVSAEDAAISKETRELVGDDTMIVVTKGDLVGGHNDEEGVLKAFSESTSLNSADVHIVSVKSGEGMDAFMGFLGARVAGSLGVREAPALTRIRHRQSLEQTVEHLERFQANAGIDPVLAAEDARMAARALGAITGRVDVEDILDVVFSDFCIGK